MKILIEESVLRQALDALLLARPAYVKDRLDLHDNAITALRSALDAAEKVEPVAIAAANIDVRTLGYVQALQDIHYNTPLYTHPAIAKVGADKTGEV